jgi:hypothetical protein
MYIVSYSHGDDIHITCRVQWDAVWSGRYLPTHRPGWFKDNVLCLFSESTRFGSRPGHRPIPGGGVGETK